MNKDKKSKNTNARVFLNTNIRNFSPKTKKKYAEFKLNSTFLNFFSFFL